MNKPKNKCFRIQRMLHRAVIVSVAIIIIVPLDISSWLTALLHYAF